MNEIKFRLWDGIKFIYQDDIYWIDFKNNIASVFDQYDYSKEININKRLSQYIGIDTVGGKNIYNGDIILSKDILWLVEPINSFSENEGYYVQMVSCLKNGELYPIDKSILKGKIVGNIYETPELFKIKYEV